MKKRLFATLAAMFALVLCLAGCSAGAENAAAGAENQEGGADQEATRPTSITVTHDLGTVEVPYDPERIAILDLPSLDIIDSLGRGDRVVGVPKGSPVSYLEPYMEDSALVDLGTLKEVDMEALMEIEPDVIFIGGRLTDSYEEISKIAPTVLITNDREIGLLKSIDANLELIGSLFGLEDEALAKTKGFADRIEKLNAAASGQTCIMGIVTSGSFNTLGNAGRCSLIVNEIGFDNLAADVESTHGDSVSFELLVDKSPDYIFVLDRDSAIGADGAAAAQEIMENALVQQTDAYKDGQIVYLNPAVWYRAEGGITALGIMLQDIEKGIR